MLRDIWRVAVCAASLAIFALSSFPLHAQAIRRNGMRTGLRRTGTLIVMRYADPSRVNIAADSLAQEINSTGARVRDQMTCKLLALSPNFVYAAAGFTEYVNSGSNDPILSFNADDLANDAFREMFRNDKYQLALRVGIAWGDAFAKALNYLADRHPTVLTNIADHSVAHAFFVAREVDNHISAVMTTMTYDRAARSSPVSPHSEVLRPGQCPSAFCSIGYTDVFDEFVYVKSERARVARKQWEQATADLSNLQRDRLSVVRFVDLTEAYHHPIGEVGGFVDSLELGTTGPLHWITRSEECPAKAWTKK